jgi:hypothetical protein
MDKCGHRGCYAILCRRLRRQTPLLEDLPAQCNNMGRLEDQTVPTLYDTSISIEPTVRIVVHSVDKRIQV